ncbi:MAG: hypothetical protein QOE36_2777 [Gaiellaceae bacterium]|nr:hypothetical protein [Gaiellaceae bacterium]
MRRADPRDAEALVALGRAVAAEPEGWLITTNGGWRGPVDERRYLRAIRRSLDAAVYVAVLSGGEVVGRLSVARDVHPASGHVADLGLLVAKDWRRRGVGTALLEAAVVWARASSVAKLELHVFPWNEPAIELYRRFGFEEEGYRKAQYRRADGYVDAVLMALRV